MPETTEILAGLSTIANRATVVAVAWHALIVAALVALARGWHPSLRTARVLMSMPLASVAAAAFAFGNPFNGVVFLVAAIALASTAIGDPRHHLPPSRGRRWSSTVGLGMIGFGLVYPHFLEGPAAAYVYAAPVGLIPCPTLAATIGFSLLGDGLGTRVWSVSLAVLGLFYGLFGMLHLGVLLDGVLIAGSVALVAAALTGIAGPLRGR
jgi:hypothetical protein